MASRREGTRIIGTLRSPATRCVPLDPTLDPPLDPPVDPPPLTTLLDALRWSADDLDPVRLPELTPRHR
ncbi:MAG: hypothetical protein ABI336_08210 [Humibacillus sp.]